MWRIRSLLLVLAALVAGLPEMATGQTRKAPPSDLGGVWSNGYLTTLERPPQLKSLIVPDAEARAFEAGHKGKPVFPPDDDVGQDDTEWWDMGKGLARIDGSARSSWIVEPQDGRLPYSEAGLAKVRAAQAANFRDFDNPEARPPAERCLLGSSSKMGPPMVNGSYSNAYLIVQTADHVVIYTEAVHDVRIIPIGKRPHLPPAIRPWMGDSIGWWEGRTLIVETTNLHPGDGLRTSGRVFLSPGAKVTERFTRSSPTALRYDYLVEDPAMFTRPWRGEAILETTTAPLLPYDCHEGNYAMRNVLGGAREAEARQAVAGR